MRGGAKGYQAWRAVGNSRALTCVRQCECDSSVGATFPSILYREWNSILEYFKKEGKKLSYRVVSTPSAGSR